jgi:hypothetical protein
VIPEVFPGLGFFGLGAEVQWGSGGLAGIEQIVECFYFLPKGAAVAVVFFPGSFECVSLFEGEMPGERLEIWIGCVAEAQHFDWRDGLCNWLA